MVDIDWKHLITAILFAVIPSVGAAILIGIVVESATSVGLGVGFLLFSYLFYQQSTKKAIAASMLWWLAVEVLLSPLALALFTIVFASGQGNSLRQTGAAIGGFAMVIGAFVVGVPLAGVLYLISRRIKPEESGTVV